LPASRHFIHREHHRLDPAFQREERRYLDHERAVLHVMERHRDQLQHDLERAQALARKAGINLDRPRRPEDEIRLMVIGVGLEGRRDDAAALELARRLRAARPRGVRVVQEEGEPKSLLEAWAGADEVLLVDAVESDFPAGTLHRFDVSDQPLPKELFRPPTHELGVADAVELGHKLDRLPGRLAVYGLEGARFEEGKGLTPQVEAAVEELAVELERELSPRQGDHP
jgi:hydrogenase maturation protease